MTNNSRGHQTEDNAIDDIGAYVATFSEDERADLAVAEEAIDIAILLHRAREHRGLTQAAAARLAGLQQQAVSRLEQPSVTPNVETVRKYLNALGYDLNLRAIDRKSDWSTATVAGAPTGEEQTVTLVGRRVLLPSASDAVNSAYAYMEASEVANRQITVAHHADAIALWGRALTLYREGVNGEADFSKVSGDPDRLRARQVQSHLLVLAVNSAKAALDLSLNGYYGPAFSTVRHMIESFTQCTWLMLRPSESVRWFDLQEEKTSSASLPRMKQLVDQIGSDLVAGGQSKEKVTAILDRVYRSWRLMSKGSHPSSEGLAQTYGAHDGQLLIGGMYQPDMCLVALDHGLFSVATLLPQALAWIRPQNPDWMADWKKLEADVSAWRSSIAGEVSVAEERLSEAA